MITNLILKFNVTQFGPFVGYDMRENLKTDWKTQGQYSTDVFTTKAVELINKHDTTIPLFLYLSQIAPHAGPKKELLQAPEEEIEKHKHIPNHDKRIYAGKKNNVTNNHIAIKHTPRIIV